MTSVIMALRPRRSFDGVLGRAASKFSEVGFLKISVDYCFGHSNFTMNNTVAYLWLHDFKLHPFKNQTLEACIVAFTAAVSFAAPF